MPKLVPLRIVIAGGGTGGHLFPGIAVAQELKRRKQDAKIVFVGTARGLESRVVTREGYLLDLIRSAGLKKQSLLALLKGLSLLPLSALDSWRVISRHSPHIVIGLGGYSSGPVMIISALRQIPTLLLEQNAVPGVTNRLLAFTILAAAVNYKDTLRYFRGKGFVSGNPVRQEFFSVSAGSQGSEVYRNQQISHLLVLGGSQGAHALNVAMVDALSELAAVSQPMSITHQSGESDFEMVKRSYRNFRLKARVEPFLRTIDQEMREADMVVCRAGATTLAELSAIGLPAILIPLPSASDDHQRKNAQLVVDAGAAELIDQVKLSGQELARRIILLGSDKERRVRMAESARRLSKPAAAGLIVDRILELVGQ